MKTLWGIEFWSDGYFFGSLGEYENKQMIRKYVQQQGDPKLYKALVKQQLTLFELLIPRYSAAGQFIFSL